jgi:hypothetical protein
LLKMALSTINQIKFLCFQKVRSSPTFVLAQVGRYDRCRSVIYCCKCIFFCYNAGILSWSCGEVLNVEDEIKIIL